MVALTDEKATVFNAQMITVDKHDAIKATLWHNGAFYEVDGWLRGSMLSAGNPTGLDPTLLTVSSVTEHPDGSISAKLFYPTDRRYDVTGSKKPSPIPLRSLIHNFLDEGTVGDFLLFESKGAKLFEHVPDAMEALAFVADQLEKLYSISYGDAYERWCKLTLQEAEIDDAEANRLMNTFNLVWHFADQTLPHAKEE